jgi:hypothetical protein
MADFSDHPRCATCTYWRDAGEWDVPKGFRRCFAAPMSSDMVQWDPISKSTVALPQYENVTMSAMDGSTYKADVHTRGNHYCPMHSDFGLVFYVYEDDPNP